MRRNDTPRRRRRQPTRTPSVELVADPQRSPDLLTDFSRQVSGAFTAFAGALRDKDTVLEAIDGLRDLCRAAYPSRFDVEVATMCARATAALFDQLGTAPPIFVRPVPDGNSEHVPPSTLAITRPDNFESVLRRFGFTLREPLPAGPLAWGHRMETTDPTDPGATVIPFCVPIEIPWGTSSDLRARLDREPLALDLHGVASLLKRTVSKLDMALASLPKSAGASPRERRLFVTWTSAYIHRCTGRWMDAVTATLHHAVFGEPIKPDAIRMARQRLFGRRSAR